MRRDRRVIGTAALGVCLALTAAARPAWAQVELDGTFDGSIVLRGDLGAVVDESTLSDGLRHVLDISASVARADEPGTVLATWRQRCVVTYDHFMRSFVVVLSRAAEIAPAVSLTAFEQVREACVARIGRDGDYAEHAGERVVVTGHVTLDAPTSDAIHRLRRWVRNPDATEDWVPSYLGVVVQVFISRSLFSPVAETPFTTPPFLLERAAEP